MPLIIEVVS